METTYNPHSIERHWYNTWESKGYFTPQLADESYCRFQENKTHHDLDREAFIDRIWNWKLRKLRLSQCKLFNKVI